jgi:hypothetical protein
MPKFKTMFVLTLVVSGAAAQAQHPAHVQPMHPFQQAQMHQMMMHQQQMMVRQQQAMMAHHQQQMMMMAHQQWLEKQRQEQEARNAAALHGAGSVPASAGSAVSARSSSAGLIPMNSRLGRAQSHQSKPNQGKPQPSGEAGPKPGPDPASGRPTASNTEAETNPTGKPAWAHKHHSAAQETKKAAGARAKHHSFLLIWPESSSVAYANLMNLKRTLHSISRTAEPTPGQRILLKNCLEAVTNSPRPAAQQVQNLANDITVTIANRGLPELDTQALALQFRALMNGAHLSGSQIAQTLTDNRLVWSASQAAPPQINVVAGDLQTIAMQFRARLD